MWFEIHFCRNTNEQSWSLNGNLCWQIIGKIFNFTFSPVPFNSTAVIDQHYKTNESSWYSPRFSWLCSTCLSWLEDTPDTKLRYIFGIFTLFSKNIQVAAAVSPLHLPQRGQFLWTRIWSTVHCHFMSFFPIGYLRMIKDLSWNRKMVKTQMRLQEGSGYTMASFCFDSSSVASSEDCKENHSTSLL